MGSKVGVIKVAAKRIGIPLNEYIELVSSGLKWCTKCRTWKLRNDFGQDSTRSDGLETKCYKCRSLTTNGPTKKERADNKKVGLAWCRRCHNWLPINQVRGGLCKAHHAEYARERYHSDINYRLERREHVHSRKRGLYPIPADIQKEIMEQFDGKCAYCQESATTWDHIVPVSQGGNSTPGNVVPCCQSCNSSKKDIDLYEWVEKTDKCNLHPRLLDILSLAECVRY